MAHSRPKLQLRLPGMIRRALLRCTRSAAQKPDAAHLGESGVSSRQITLCGVSSLSAGVVYGAVGVGSGIVSIAGLTRLVGLPQLQAIGTSTPGQAFSSISGAAIWSFDGCCDLATAACLGVPGLFGALFGLNVASKLPEAKLRLGFAGMLCLIIAPLAARSAYMGCSDSSDKEAAASSQLKARRPFMARLRDDVEKLKGDPARAACHCVVGAGIGVLTGSLATGDSMLMILYLIASGFEQRLALGTTLLASSLPYLLTVVVHLGRGSAVPVLVPASMISMCLGSCLGAQVSCKSLSNEQLQTGLAGGALTVGLLTARDVLKRF
ncbi:unnamed protein product [Symbiodinium natans]|uniref:Membrane transporter protein n=1 Tax=Symbiodinium natans TaxID=878477 RepID=A0A812LJZ7_9DINO|nr:unnamed protein product [Symbiodinium natans]